MSYIYIIMIPILIVAVALYIIICRALSAKQFVRKQDGIVEVGLHHIQRYDLKNHKFVVQVELKRGLIKGRAYLVCMYVYKIEGDSIAYVTTHFIMQFASSNTKKSAEKEAEKLKEILGEDVCSEIINFRGF